MSTTRILQLNASAARRGGIGHLTVSLDSEFGVDVVRRAVTAFLSIRPSGGRLWVDDDGDASTLVRGRLVYLGRLAVSAPARALSPGSRLAELPDGPHYVLHHDDVLDPDADRRLSQVRGRAVAKAVARRLRTAKPAGGRIWVSRDGLAAARDPRDAHPYYLGHVSVDEWFSTRTG